MSKQKQINAVNVRRFTTNLSALDGQEIAE